ncbi:MAG: hypothetical protein M3Y87_00635 [Myxococcota bacterium]|nr:hypothetical protein [Myxococcota bacterium]
MSRSLFSSPSLVSSAVLLVALAMGGCGESRELEPDAGIVISVDAFVPPAFDAGTDANVPTPIDAGGIDAMARPDGSILPPLDGGDPFVDAGALGSPPFVAIDVLYDGSECDPLVPCGGDVVGTWDVQGGCIQLPDIEGMVSMCPGGTVTTRTARARGRVEFDATIARRVAQSEVELEVFLPAFCASFIGGCGAIETQLRMQAPDSACITEPSGDCLCATRQLNTIDDTDAYTIDGNEIVSSTGQRWAYCVDGDALRYEDVTPTPDGGPAPMREPGIIDLGRR